MTNSKIEVNYNGYIIEEFGDGFIIVKDDKCVRYNGTPVVKIFKHIEYAIRTKIKEVINEMTHNYYYLYNGRIYNDDGTAYKKFRFVVFFDAMNIAEWYEDKEVFSNSDILNYADELAFSITQSINDFNNCGYFYELCNHTIERYNDTFFRGIA